MPIEFLTPPELVQQAADAYLQSQGNWARSLALGSRVMLAEPTAGTNIWLRYPHVMIDVHDLSAPFDIQPYAWQLIHGKLDDPVSLEISDDTDGEASSTTIVQGPRLRQTVAAINAALTQHADSNEQYKLKLLHLRAIAFRSIVLEHEDPAKSIAIPLAPAPQQLARFEKLPLMELLEILRTVVPQPSEPAHEDHRPIPATAMSRTTTLTFAKEDIMPQATESPITMTRLLDLSIDPPTRPEGDLNPVIIVPAPEAGIIRSDRIYCITTLPGLGQPQKAPPDGSPGGPGGGQYIEVLIDDQPATGRITTQIPHEIVFSESPGTHPSLRYGTHTLHFFVSPGDGECIKDEHWIASQTIHVQHKTPGAPESKGKIIIYNLPRTMHRSDNVIVDFALIGVDFTENSGIREMHDHMVRVYIQDDRAGVIYTKDTRYYNAHRLTGLTPRARYRIWMEIVTRNGESLPTVGNPFAVTRKREFRVF